MTSSGGAGSVALTGTILGGGTLATNYDLSGLPDGTLTASATLTDAAGNTSGAGTDTAIKDTVNPTAPTVNIVPTYVNNANKTSVSITVSGEVGATVAGTVTSSGGAGSVALTGTILVGGTLGHDYDLAACPTGP